MERGKIPATPLMVVRMTTHILSVETMPVQGCRVQGRINALRISNAALATSTPSVVVMLAKSSPAQGKTNVIFSLVVEQMNIWSAATINVLSFLRQAQTNVQHSLAVASTQNAEIISVFC